MHIGFLVSAVETERPKNTTIRLAMQASNLGHTVWLIGLGDVTRTPGGSLLARAHGAPPRTNRDSGEFLEALRGRSAIIQTIAVDQLDVLMLRSNPADDARNQPWAQMMGIMFGRLAAEKGVLVLNNPDGLSHAMNKVYLESFPEEVRPRTLITRDRQAIKQFAKQEAAPIILKPLSGYGGQNVFIVQPGEQANINQMVEAISRDGYVIAQEYLPEAAHGDVRLFVLDGQPLCVKGHYAAFQRIRPEDDIRNNVRAGGRIEKAEITAAMLHTVDLMRPRLEADGMFLVGVDFAGSKVLEINVFSPGGLGSAKQVEGVSFTKTVITRMAKRLANHRT
ncbi:MAG: glutathione synthase [Anaerolineae bacterium]